MFDKFNHVSDKRILVVGDIMLDKYIHGHTTRISPEAPVPIVAVDQTTHVLGGASNVAANLQSMGAQAVLIGMVGNDPNGILLKTMISNQLKSDEGIIIGNRKTTTKTRIVSQNHQMLRIDEEEVRDIDANEEDSIFKLIEKSLQEKEVHGIVLQDYNKGLLTQNLIKQIISFCLSKNIPFFVDPKHDNFWSYQGANLFKPNLSELLKANDSQQNNSLDDILLATSSKLKCSILMCTLAEKGIAYIENGKVEYTPTQKIDVVDVSGAGDSALSIMVLAYLLEYDAKTISILANLCGKVVCMKSGVSQITIQELKDAFNSVRQDIAI